jgi:cytochrome c oxidase subunit 2
MGERKPKTRWILAATAPGGVPAATAAEWGWNFPPPVTPVALDTLRVHNKFMIITLAIFLIVFAVMVYSIITHRKSRGHEPAKFTGPGTAAQLIWSTIPFLILLYLDFILMGIPAFHSVLFMEDTRADADMVVKVTGSQWKWQYEYPDEGIRFVSALATPQAQIENRAPKNPDYLLEVDHPLVLPVGRKVRILLTSTDVIHSWWVPQFGVKRDAIPGFLRETWVRIERPGTYRGQCSELCGKGHAFMPIVVQALPEPQYRQWLTREKARLAAVAASAGRVWAREELVKKGQEVYEKVCQVCHQPQGQGVPGAFPALAGSRIVNGPFIDMHGRLVKDGHLDRVLNGKPGTAMQAFKTTLNDVEIAAVVTYERNAFGNRMGDAVQPAQVAALR